MTTEAKKTQVAELVGDIAYPPSRHQYDKRQPIHCVDRYTLTPQPQSRSTSTQDIECNLTIRSPNHRLQYSIVSSELEKGPSSPVLVNLVIQVERKPSLLRRLMKLWRNFKTEDSNQPILPPLYSEVSKRTAVLSPGSDLSEMDSSTCVHEMNAYHGFAELDSAGWENEKMFLADPDAESACTLPLYGAIELPISNSRPTSIATWSAQPDHASIHGHIVSPHSSRQTHMPYGLPASNEPCQQHPSATLQFDQTQRPFPTCSAPLLYGSTLSESGSQNNFNTGILVPDTGLGSGDVLKQRIPLRIKTPNPLEKTGYFAQPWSRVPLSGTTLSASPGTPPSVTTNGSSLGSTPSSTLSQDPQSYLNNYMAPPSAVNKRDHGPAESISIQSANLSPYSTCYPELGIYAPGPVPDFYQTHPYTYTHPFYNRMPNASYVAPGATSATTCSPDVPSATLPSPDSPVSFFCPCCGTPFNGKQRQAKRNLHRHLKYSCKGTKKESPRLACRSQGCELDYCREDARRVHEEKIHGLVLPLR